MKNIIFLTLVGSAAMAADFGGPVSLECIPVAPCKYASEGLNCVSKILVSGRAGGRGIEEIHFRPENISREVMIVPQKYAVLIGYSPNSLSFHDQTGDQSGQLKATRGAKYVGTITVDQDFSFSVSCQNKALGLRSL